jgi:hypothetical protein
MAAAGMPKPQRQSSSHPSRLGRFQQAAQMESKDCVPRTLSLLHDDADELGGPMRHLPNLDLNCSYFTTMLMSLVVQ